MDHIENLAKTDSVFRIANRLYSEAYDPHNRHRNCHAWAWCFHHAFKMNGVRSCMMSGSAKWPAIDDGHEDGILHFGYVYDAELADRTPLNKPVEGHSWVFLPDRHLIMDPTAGYLERQSKETQPHLFGDREWDSEFKPPDVITHDIRQPFIDFEYTPSRHASIFFVKRAFAALPLPV